MKPRILVVEDEPSILDNILYSLETEGFEPRGCATGGEARAALAGNGFALVVLDIGLPDGTGFELCKEIRRQSNVPVIFLTARGAEVDRIVGLEIGGDDYLPKPFSPRELVARVRALLRRAESTPLADESPRRGPITHGPISLDLDRHEARFQGAVVELTATEFGMLVALFERPGVVLTRTQLMQRAYTYDNLITDRTIDTHVKRVRAKFRAHDFDPIFTVFGVGYKASGG